MTALVLRLAIVSATDSLPKVAIIIDDFGNGSDGTDEILSLPIKLTGAVMPFMPKSDEEVARLNESGKEVILHQPMEAHTGKRSWLGETPILKEMTPAQASDVFNKNAESVGATGFNNHMGSAITEDREKMRAIFTSAKERDMFFVDSVTTAKSVAEEVAKEVGIKYAKRDVFLDSTQDKEQIKNNLKKAIKIANEKGSAIAIGHVGAEGGKVTAKAIEEVICEVGDSVEFVFVSELVK